MSPRNGQISKIVQNRISALRSKNLEQGNLLSQKVSPKTRFFFASSLAGAHLNSVFWLLTTGLAWALLNWNFPMQARALGKFPIGKPGGGPTQFKGSRGHSGDAQLQENGRLQRPTMK